MYPDGTIQMLRVCWLAEIADPATDFDRVDSWAEIFSVGEQQRIAFLRLLRAQPVLAILDEATSAMDIATERTMYQELAGSCRSYVSVGHRPQLAEFHTHVLTWQAPGIWQLAESNQAQQSAAKSMTTL
jgi:vitamin B12/bleomycin/antimicrobial peptide transport system ATP-binding/permease protein